MTGKGGPSAPDLRAIIKSEMDLLERIPEDQVTRRTALEQVIAQHIDALVMAIEKSRDLQRRTSYFVQNWRDLVLFLTTVLFTVVAWHADHHRPLWLPIFIAAILLSVVAALYVLRGFLRHVRTAPRATTNSATATAIPSERDVDAHLSEGIPRFWLLDNTALETFVDNELRFGLQVAVEAKVLADINGTSGIQTQPYATSCWPPCARA